MFDMFPAFCVLLGLHSLVCARAGFVCLWIAGLKYVPFVVGRGCEVALVILRCVLAPYPMPRQPVSGLDGKAPKCPWSLA